MAVGQISRSYFVRQPAGGLKNWQMHTCSHIDQEQHLGSRHYLIVSVRLGRVARTMVGDRQLRVSRLSILY